MPTQRAPQYILDTIERLARRAARMERTCFGMKHDRVKLSGPGVDPDDGASDLSVDELIKSKTKNWRASYIEPDLALLKSWAQGESVAHDEREGAK